MEAARTRGAVVAVDPARDRVAAEVDDIAAEAIELGDDGVKDPIQVRRQLLGPALRSELVGKRLGQRVKPEMSAKSADTVNAVGHRHAGAERPAAVARDVGVRRGRGSRSHDVAPAAGGWVVLIALPLCGGRVPSCSRARGFGTPTMLPRGTRR